MSTANSFAGKVLTVRAAGLTWALPGDQVADILPHRQAIRAPGSAPFVEGFVRYQDGLLPVVDLSARFRLPAERRHARRAAGADGGAARQTLVIPVSGGPAGLTVDEVVASWDAAGVSLLPLPGMTSSRVVLGCLTDPDGHLLVVLDPRAILETDAPLDLPVLAGASTSPAEEPAAGASALPPGAVLVVRAAGYSWGVLGSDVEEVLPHQPATPAPNTPPFVEGLVRYRDDVLPVVDLSVRFRPRARPGLAAGAPRTGGEPGRQTLVIPISGGLAGLTVDEVLGLRQGDGARLVPLPGMASSPVVRGCLVEPGGNLLVVLDPRAILETDAPLDLPLSPDWLAPDEERPRAAPRAGPERPDPSAPSPPLPGGAPRPARPDDGRPPAPSPASPAAARREPAPAQPPAAPSGHRRPPSGARPAPGADRAAPTPHDRPGGRAEGTGAGSPTGGAPGSGPEPAHAEAAGRDDAATTPPGPPAAAAGAPGAPAAGPAAAAPPRDGPHRPGPRQESRGELPGDRRAEPSGPDVPVPAGAASREPTGRERGGAGGAPEQPQPPARHRAAAAGERAAPSGSSGAPADRPAERPSGPRPGHDRHSGGLLREAAPPAAARPAAAPPPDPAGPTARPGAPPPEAPRARRGGRAGGTSWPDPEPPGTLARGPRSEGPAPSSSLPPYPPSVGHGVSPPRPPAGGHRRPARPRTARRLAAVTALILAAGAGWFLARPGDERSAPDPAAPVAAVEATGPAEAPSGLAVPAPPDQGTPARPRGAGDAPAADGAAAGPAGPDRRGGPLVLTIEETGPGVREAEREGAGPTVVEVVEYTVRRGDTLWDIAERFTRNPFRYREIASQNALHNPALIFPGQRLILRIERPGG